MSVEQLTAEALKLPVEEREQLASILYSSLPEDDDPELTAELKRRLDEIQSGKVKTIPWEETMARVDAVLNARKEVTPAG
jgi:putative addiction module component (TIGR02574 family)